MMQLQKVELSLIKKREVHDNTYTKITNTTKENKMQEKKLLYGQISETIVKDHKSCTFYMISLLLKGYHIMMSFD